MERDTRASGKYSKQRNKVVKQTVKYSVKLQCNPYREIETNVDYVNELDQGNPYTNDQRGRTFIIQNPFVLGLHKRRQQLAFLFKMYKLWKYGQTASVWHHSILSRSECYTYYSLFPHDLPPLADVLTGVSTLPQTVAQLKVYPSEAITKVSERKRFEEQNTEGEWIVRFRYVERILTKEEARKYYNAKAKNLGNPLKQSELDKWMQTVQRLRDMTNVSIGEWKNYHLSKRRGYETVYPWLDSNNLERRDSLLSALPSASWLANVTESHDEYSNVIAKELTEDFLDTFIKFYSSHEFHDSATARAKHALPYESYTRQQVTARDKKSWSRARRRTLKSQVHKDGTYDET